MTDTYTASLAAETIKESSLYNQDLAPVAPARRTWRTYNYAALWISMSVNIPTYMLASGMIAGGMNWKQALFTVFLGNVLVLVPMLLNAHAGAQYGIPFPVFARASFGVLGANVPAILRALVACGWFGIQTWIGGEAINARARDAWFDVDLRGDGSKALQRLEKRARGIVSVVPPGISVDVEELGRRPAGSVAPASPIARAAVTALRRAGLPAELSAASTDANAALDLGIPAVALGVTRGQGEHTPGEWIETDPVPAGLMALADTIHLLRQEQA